MGFGVQPLRGIIDAFAATSLGSRCIRALVPLDRRLLSRTKGRYTVLGPFDCRCWC